MQLADVAATEGYRRGVVVAAVDPAASHRLGTLIRGCAPVALEGALLETQDFGERAAQSLAGRLAGRQVDLLIHSGATDRFTNLTLLSIGKRFLAPRALLLLDNADLAGVYEGMREALMGEPAYRLESIAIADDDRRPGQGVALLSFDRDRTAVQPAGEIPASKNKRLGEAFQAAAPVRDLAAARARVDAAVASWTPSGERRARAVHDALATEFPDGESPKAYWHDAWQSGFTQFFTWGHDQDFGCGLTRPGAMGTRHLEIVAESIAWDYLPERLDGLEVLDVGCWSGGDVLALAGLGARVTALEEHPVSAPAAARLCELLEVPAAVEHDSLYHPREAWRGRFDLVYISGVVYHVTDPLLALRICYAYLKPGGRLVVETKASKLDGPHCEYAGTLEKGWNWYAPTLETLGRWLVDAGFPRAGVRLHMRPVGRLLAGATKGEPAPLQETAGFSRPGSWLEGPC